ncbi:hypothetical protein [Mucisphaera sp.]
MQQTPASPLIPADYNLAFILQVFQLPLGIALASSYAYDHATPLPDPIG